MTDAEDSDVETAVYALPVEPYLGLTVAAAEARAAREGCDLVIASGWSVRTFDLVPPRIHVVLGDDGRVVAAERG